MGEYKYPYIKGGKSMVAAVLGACSYIRETGYFNRAVTYYANKYNVSETELARNIRARQAAGQRENGGRKRVYKWFAIEYSMGNERNGAAYFEPLEAQYSVAKGVSAETVKARLSKRDDYVSEYAPCHWFGRVAACDSEDEARKLVEEWKSEIPL